MDDPIIINPSSTELPHAQHHCDEVKATAFRSHVKVIAKAGLPNGKVVEFELQSNLIDPFSGLLVFNKTNNAIKKKDYYLIDFDLEDHTGLNLMFNPNPMKALWVAMGDAMSHLHVRQAPPTAATFTPRRSTTAAIR